MSEPETSAENLTLDFTTKDPVCGMIVEPPHARGKARYQGDTYYFCSPDCMHKFMASPLKYAVAAGMMPASSLPAPMAAARKLDRDPVCGMNVDPAKAASTAEYEGRLYHFCSRGCAEKFRRSPDKYLDAIQKPAPLPVMRQPSSAMVQIGTAGKVGNDSPTSSHAASARAAVVDPVCGMNIDPAKAASAVTVGVNTYYFCCRACGEKFTADPAKYLNPAAATPTVPQVPGSVSSSVPQVHVPRLDVNLAARTLTWVPRLRLPDGSGDPPRSSRRMPEVRHGARARASHRNKNAVDLPHASRDRARCAGLVSHLRHGAGAQDRHRRDRRESRTPRHDAPLLDQRHHRHSAHRLRHGPHDSAHHGAADVAASRRARSHAAPRQLD